MTRRGRPALRRWLGGVLASLLMMAAVSGLVALLKPHLPALYLLVLYVLVVLAVAIVWGTALALLASVLSAAVFAYLFVPPVNRFEVADWRSLAALAVFLVTAVVVGGLAARLRQAARTPSSCPVSCWSRARGCWPAPTRPAARSSATCTTAPSSGWSRWPCSCGWPRPRCPPNSAT